MRGKRCETGCGDVFKFGGHRHALRAELGQCTGIGIAGAQQMIGRMTGGTIGSRFQYRDFIAHSLRRMREHATQLTTAHHAQPGGR